MFDLWEDKGTFHVYYFKVLICFLFIIWDFKHRIFWHYHTDEDSGKVKKVPFIMDFLFHLIFAAFSVDNVIATCLVGIKAFSYSSSGGWSSRILIQSLIWKSSGSFSWNDAFPSYLGSWSCHESWWRVWKTYLLNQDTLACAVAEEMQKIYKDELGPEPVPLTVPGKAITEEEVSLILFICVITLHQGILPHL